MHPFVRDLYKRILLIGRNYPLGLDRVREKAKEEFRKNAQIDTQSIEFKQAIAYGRYMTREMEAVIALKKYRAMKSGDYYS
jgi:hypothetical protein